MSVSKWVVVLLVIAGCGHPDLPETIVSKIVKVETIPTSFNESVKSQVETTVGTYVVLGNAQCKKGGDCIQKGNWLSIEQPDGSIREYRIVK